MPDSKLQREYGAHLFDEARAGRMTRRRLIQRATVLGLSAAFIGELLSACGGTEEDVSPGAGGTISVAMIEPAGALDPVSSFDSGSIAAGQLVAEYLNWLDAAESLRPVLAERWEPDEKVQTWTFQLRKGVKFSDGRPLTADDVVATFDRLTKMDDADLKQILSKGNTEKVDDHTVVFHLDRPFADFPTFAGVANYNAVILPANYDGDFEKNPVGTGPFLLTDIAPKQSVSFKKNPDYWQPELPLLDEVEFRFYAEDQAQVLALQGGEVDMMLDTSFQGSQALFSDPNIEVLDTPSSAHRALHMRVDQEPWKDKRVRQALAYSLNRDQIVEGLFGEGLGDVGNDHIFAPDYGIEIDVPQRAQDYDRAKQLLADAGYPDGVKVTLTTEDFLEIPQYVTIVKDMAAPAGFDITLEIQQQGKYYGSGDNQPWLEVPLGVVDWTSRPVSGQMNLAYTCGAIWNSAHWCNKEFDRLAGEFQATLDEGSRQQIATQMATIMQDETPVIISYWLKRLRAVRSTVEGVEADPRANLDLSNAAVS